MSIKRTQTLLAEANLNESLQKDLDLTQELIELEEKIEEKVKFLETKNQVLETGTVATQINPTNFNTYFSADSFSLIDKNSLLAVIIGGLLLILAARVIYD